MHHVEVAGLALNTIGWRKAFLAARGTGRTSSTFQGIPLQAIDASTSIGCTALSTMLASGLAVLALATGEKVSCRAIQTGGGGIAGQVGLALIIDHSVASLASRAQLLAAAELARDAGP